MPTTRTPRIPFFLLLEGDEDGTLILEGDMRTGSEPLKLEGDFTVIAGTVTRRVTELVE